MKIPVLFPKIFNYPFTYQSEISDSLNPGDFVKAPFGSNEITGVVWPEEQKTEKNFKFKKIIKKINIPNLNSSMIKFISWFSKYNLVPLGMSLKMSLLNKDVVEKSFNHEFNKNKIKKNTIKLSLNAEQKKALAFLKKTVRENIPKAGIEWKGKSEELQETSNEMFVIFALALLTAYLVMCAMFNSFIHPLVIMLTVPLSILGGIIFLLLFNSSINIFSQIALVILIGISTKNSILIVDWANQLRRAGKNIQSAALEACRLRFRAIIMTSLSTMIAMIPLIVGNIGPGAGEGSRMAVGATILGGMLISTFFTLYVTPTMYVLLTKNTKRIDTVDIQLNKELKR